MSKLRFLGALLVGASVIVACSDEVKRPPAPGASGSGGSSGDSGSSGKSGNAGEGAHDAGGDPGVAGGSGEGGDQSGSAGEGGANNGGTSNAGTAGDTNVNAGGYGEIIPPVGPSPLCLQQVVWAEGARIALSGAGDEVLQAVTPNELTIAWKSGSEFYVADRAQAGDAFGAPMLLADSGNYQAVSLSADGLKLVALSATSKEYFELVREPGQAFGEPSEGDFSEFNTALRGDPTPGVTLADAVLSADDESFFYSYFRSDGVGASAFESQRNGGYWALAGTQLGTVLDADGSGKRRIPTSLAADGLTLFYRDEIEGDFRAAWRVNRNEPFEHAEPVSPAAGTVAAAPNGDCSMLYFSAPGTEGIDLFVSARQ